MSVRVVTRRVVASRIVLLGAAAILCAGLSSAQTTGTGSGTGTGTGGSTGGGIGAGRGSVGTGVGSSTVTVPAPSTAPPPPATATPIYLMGKVAMEDGSPPPGLATIERVCNGIPHNAGYADTKGSFSIEFGNEQGVFQDATDGAGVRSNAGAGGGAGRSASAQERLLQNCELRAKLPGYRSQSIILAGRRSMDDPNVGTILLHKEGPSEGTTVSATSLAAPRGAQKLFEKGIDLAKKDKFPDALESFQKALEIYPNYAAAWTELGKVQLVMARGDEARFAFENAIKLDAKFVGPYVELSRMEYEAKHWPQLVEISARGMRLDPFDYPQLFLLNGIAHYYMRETDLAEKSVTEAERLDTQRRFPETAHLHGLVLAQRREFAGACQYLRDYLRLVPNAADTEVVRGQLALYEKSAPTASVEKH